MLDTEIAGAMVQFGMAGLIGWMWLTERRSASNREKQLDEAHERLMQERIVVQVFLETMRENTRVLSHVEAGQRALVTTLATWRDGRDERGERGERSDRGRAGG